MVITNEDNMELMARYEDNYFDLAIVDPPYGLGDKTTKGGCSKNSQVNFKEHQWDNAIPTNKYFDELFRVSKKQIIWGGNYFPYIWKNSCRGLITWDKMVYIPTMSQIEFAWYSEDKLPKLVKINNNDSNRTHPTQKPVKLYEWLLMNYAKEGDKILDTHLGSGSIALACHNLKYDLTACELDKEYYEAAMKRLKEHQQQLKFGKLCTERN
jgi:site-specific DNA-methyltransferase (adenine-specific)